MKLGIIGHHSTDPEGNRIETYYWSMVESFKKHGVEVKAIKAQGFEDNHDVDHYLMVDCGRNIRGQQSILLDKLSKPSSAYLIDSHGNPSLHRRVSKKVDHVFFCVWDRRDLYAKHESAHWSPNFTDMRWFNGLDREDPIKYDFGFFGSKHGLYRAEQMEALCAVHGWTCDIRQINNQFKHRWPHTANAMAQCKNLFNRGQKHDGPNLRVMESMAMMKPLITDVDPRSGLQKLFQDNVHFLGYYDKDTMKEAMQFCIKEPEAAEKIAQRGYEEVRQHHTVNNRVEQILEVINA